MIQRKQTLFLIISFISNLLLLLLSPFVITHQGNKFHWHITNLSQNIGVDKTYQTLLLLTLLIIAGVIMLTILKFKKLALQIKLIRLLNFLTLISIVLITFCLSTILPSSPNNENTLSPTFIGVSSPIISFLFYFLAIRYIKKDLQLLSSINRIR